MCKGTARVARPFLYIDCAYVLLRYEYVYLSCVYFNAFFFILILMYIYIYFSSYYLFRYNMSTD